MNTLITISKRDALSPMDDDLRHPFSKNLIVHMHEELVFGRAHIKHKRDAFRTKVPREIDTAESQHLLGVAQEVVDVGTEEAAGLAQGRERVCFDVGGDHTADFEGAGGAGNRDLAVLGGPEIDYVSKLGW